MDKISEFNQQVENNINFLAADKQLALQAWKWVTDSSKHNYTYNFTWMGRPIIQLPQDMVAIQELIMKVRPDLVIETGIAHGGSLILSASLLAMLDYEDAIRTGQPLDPHKTRRRVLGIDIDIRPHNRQSIEAHAMSHRIDMIEGSSIAPETVQKVCAYARDYKTVLVCLDSNHTHEHVLAELNAYAPLASVGSYCVVFDTGIEDATAEMFADRPWGKGNNPKTAVWEYLKSHPEFEIDKRIESKIMITVAVDGYLKRVK